MGAGNGGSSGFIDEDDEPVRPIDRVQLGPIEHVQTGMVVIGLRITFGDGDVVKGYVTRAAARKMVEMLTLSLDAIE